MTNTVRRAASLGSQIADILRRRIVRGELAPGVRLTEEGLAAEFDVSRGPVRDAIAQLSLEKLVEVHKPRGIYVTGLSDDDIEQLYSLRAAIEQLAAARAMRVRDDERWDLTRQAVARMEAAADSGDHAAFLQADLDFHSELYALAEHPRLAAVWGQYLPTFTALLEVTVNRDDDLHDSSADHVRLYALLRGDDSAVVASALEKHLEGAMARMRADATARRS